MDEIETFWNWFNDNKSRFEKIDSTNRDEKLDLVLQHLHIISNGLSVEISNEFNGIRDMVISPEGDTAKFKIVKEIVKRAPTIRGWTFTAFRQPVLEDFTLKYEDLEFTPSQMFFYPEIDRDSLDLLIYAKNIKHQDNNTVSHYGLITMDNVLGEFDCVMKVRYYNFYDIVDAKDRNILQPLTNLRAFVDSFYEVHHH